MTKVTAAHVRRAALAAAPVLGGIACVVAAIADPDPSAMGLELVEVYAKDWEAVQLKSSAYHYGYMFIGATPVGVAALVRRGRGAIIALLASALAILGISTLPGMLISDFYASAGGQLIGAEQMRALEVDAQGGWGAGAIVGPGMIGFILSLPIAVIAAARARLVHWSMPLVTIAGVASFAIGMATPAGNAVMTAWFALLGLAILRMPLAAFGERSAPVETERETLVVEGEPVAERPVAIA